MSIRHENDRDRRRSIPGERLMRLACVGIGLAIALSAIGCQSGPVLAWQGARHYASGNSALDRGEPEVAVSEFERAADLVPHASEIQNHLGLAYLAAGEPARARRAFEVALELDCDNEAAQVNLDGLDRRQGRDPSSRDRAGNGKDRGAGDPAKSTQDTKDMRKTADSIEGHVVRNDHGTQGGD